jgi:hypothetical protein
MQIIKYAFVVVLIGFVVFSCQKDDDKDDNNQNSVQLITSGAWKYDTVTIDYNKDGTPDAPGTSFIMACDRDNLITFKSDSTGTVDEGSTKCNSSDPQTTSFKWWFKNSTTLTTPDPIFAGESGDAKVTVLTSTKLQLQKEVANPLGGTVNIIADLKH